MKYVLALTLSLAVAPAFAQGTPAERIACGRDAVRYCRSELKAGVVIAVGNCMIANKTRLTPRCRAVFTAHGM